MIASSVSSMPSNAADWSAANAVSPVTTRPRGRPRGWRRRRPRRPRVASSRVWTVTSAIVPSGRPGRRPGSPARRSFSQRAAGRGASAVITRTTDESRPGAQSASRVGVDPRVVGPRRQPAGARVRDDRVDLRALVEALLDELARRAWTRPTRPRTRRSRPRPPSGARPAAAPARARARPTRRGSTHRERRPVTSCASRSMRSLAERQLRRGPYAAPGMRQRSVASTLRFERASARRTVGARPQRHRPRPSLPQLTARLASVVLLSSSRLATPGSRSG